VDSELVGRIADSSADLDALLTACERRQDLRANAGGALREYWAAIPDSEKNLTRVGRYDARIQIQTVDGNPGNPLHER
jgi:hypothetical protein